MDNRRTLSNGDNGSFIDMSASGQVSSTKTGAATSTTVAPNRFAGGLAVANTSVMNRIWTTTTSFYTIPNMVGRTATSGAGYVVSDAGAATLTTAAVLPSVGTVLRTGITPAAATTDTLPATSAMLTAVAAEMPGGVWNVGVGYMMMYVNNQASATSTWTLQRADTSTLFRTAAATLAIDGATSGNVGNYRLLYVIKVSATQILIHEI